MLEEYKSPRNWSLSPITCQSESSLGDQVGDQVGDLEWGERPTLK
jgi:hypothetical protein